MKRTLTHAAWLASIALVFGGCGTQAPGSVTPSTPSPQPPVTTTPAPLAGDLTRFKKTGKAVARLLTSGDGIPELQDATGAKHINKLLNVDENSRAYFAYYNRDKNLLCVKTREGTYFTTSQSGTGTGITYTFLIGDGECSYDPTEAYIEATMDSQGISPDWERGADLMGGLTPSDVLE